MTQFEAQTGRQDRRLYIRANRKEQVIGLLSASAIFLTITAVIATMYL